MTRPPNAGMHNCRGRSGHCGLSRAMQGRPPGNNDVQPTTSQFFVTHLRENSHERAISRRRESSQKDREKRRHDAQESVEQIFTCCVVSMHAHGT